MEDPLDYIDKKNDSDEPLHIGLKILAFLVPISGLIMFFMYRDKKPLKSKEAGIAALWGMALGLAMKLMESAIT